MVIDMTLMLFKQKYSSHDIISLALSLYGYLHIIVITVPPPFCRGLERVAVREGGVSSQMDGWAGPSLKGTPTGKGRRSLTHYL
jgi:hypothetical protein